MTDTNPNTTTSEAAGTGTATLSWTDWDSINEILVQSNGKIDLAIANDAGDLDIIQLNSDGSADTSFGSDGEEEQTSLPPAEGIALAANGDLLVAGVSSLSFVVTELNASNGALDTSYNTSGFASIALATGGTLTYIGMALAPDGDLMLAGGYKPASSLNRYATFVAITPSGSIDSAFGTSGLDVESTDIYYSAHPGFSPFAVNADGQMFLGDTYVGGSATTFTVYEYNREGSIDSAFGTSGMASETVSGERTGVILQMLTNGQIVIGAGGGNLVLVRFNANGSLDTSFGTSGIEIGAAADGGFSMTTAPNGETIMVGQSSDDDGIILQEFNTLAKSQRLYVEQDADYNTTSLTNSSGSVVIRYEYGPYGEVTLLNPNGTVLGDGSAAGTYYGFEYLHQGLRLDVVTGTYDDRNRVYLAALGRFAQPDPAGTINGPNDYGFAEENPAGRADPSGLAFILGGGDPLPASGGGISIPQSGGSGSSGPLLGPPDPSIFDSGGGGTSLSGPVSLFGPNGPLPDAPSPSGGCSNPNAESLAEIQQEEAELAALQNQQYADAMAVGLGDDGQLSAAHRWLAENPDPPVPGGPEHIFNEVNDTISDLELFVPIGDITAPIIEDGVGTLAREGLEEGSTILPKAAESEGASAFTFRGDAQSPDTIFNEGFSPRGTSTDLLSHALDNTNPPSAFVSTSKSCDVASGFGDNVYVVRPVNGIDVNSTLGPLSPFPGEQEIAIPGGVSPTDIPGMIQPGQGTSLLNPIFKP